MLSFQASGACVSQGPRIRSGIHCKAFKKFGELAEPYQPGLNALSSLSGPCTTAGVFSKGGI